MLLRTKLSRLTSERPDKRRDECMRLDLTIIVLENPRRWLSATPPVRAKCKRYAKSHWHATGDRCEARTRPQAQIPVQGPLPTFSYVSWATPPKTHAIRGRNSPNGLTKNWAECLGDHALPSRDSAQLVTKAMMTIPPVGRLITQNALLIEVRALVTSKCKRRQDVQRDASLKHRSFRL